MPQNDAAICAYTVFVSSNVIGLSRDTSDNKNIVKKTPVMNDAIMALALSFLGFMVVIWGVFAASVRPSGYFYVRPCVWSVLSIGRGNISGCLLLGRSGGGGGVMAGLATR